MCVTVQFYLMNNKSSINVKQQKKENSLRVSTLKSLKKKKLHHQLHNSTVCADVGPFFDNTFLWTFTGVKNNYAGLQECPRTHGVFLVH